MRPIKIFAMLIVFSISLQAQTDKKAQDILKSVSVKYKSLKNITAKFKLNIKDQANKAIQNQNGTLVLKGPKYKLIMGTQEILSDGKVVWTYLKDANEVQINEPKSDPGAITPQNIFTIYEKGFKSKYIGEKTVGGKVLQIIELVPEDAKRNFIKIQLTINKSEKYIAQAIVYEKSGTNYTYSIDSFNSNTEVNDTIFTFNKSNYPNVDVIDLRN